MDAPAADAAAPAPPPAAASAAAAAPDAPSSSPSSGSPASPSGQQQQPVNYEALYEQVRDKPCSVEDIQIKLEGANGQPSRTRMALIERELDRVHSARTLAEVHEALEEAGRHLQVLGVFNRIDMLVHEEPKSQPDAVSVLLALEEKNWYKLRAATYLQGGENSFEVGAGLHNVTGHGENVSVSGEYGTENSSQFNLGYEQPRPAGLPIIFDCRLHQHFRNNEKASSFTERLRGGVIGGKSLDGRHSLHYELGWRSITDPSRQASRAVLAQTGDFIKSAAKYVFLLDRRNSPVVPSSGWALRSASELAGLGPGLSALRFAKQQLDGQLVLPLPLPGLPGASLSLTASLGVLLPWDAAPPEHWLSRTTCIADRFFLGGPSSLRGFKYKGVGPSDVRRPTRTQRVGEDPQPLKRDTLGGDLYASVLASVMVPLPHPALHALKLHAHAFVNGGNNTQLGGTGQSLQERVTDFGTTFRWSAGAGLALPTWFGRFEANYVVVLSQQENDRVKRGLQLGFASSVFM